MARSYSEKFLVELGGNEEDKLGLRLARKCVKANIPAAYAAVALETSPTTVYGWFRGRGIRENKFKIVELFIEFVDEDLKNGRLPAKSMEDAKSYIENLTGVTI
jgi:hypothetical protein